MMFLTLIIHKHQDQILMSNNLELAMHASISCSLIQVANIQIMEPNLEVHCQLTNY